MSYRVEEGIRIEGGLNPHTVTVARGGACHFQPHKRDMRRERKIAVYKLGCLRQTRVILSDYHHSDLHTLTGEREIAESSHSLTKAARYAGEPVMQRLYIPHKRNPKLNIGVGQPSYFVRKPAVISITTPHHSFQLLFSRLKINDKGEIPVLCENLFFLQPNEPRELLASPQSQSGQEQPCNLV